jgi:Xaa-Pro aminopeptidase
VTLVTSVTPVSGELPAMEISERLVRLRPRVAEAGADALLVTALANVRYLTGFTGSAALVLVTGDETLLVTDGRYRTQAAEQLESAGLTGSVELVVGGVQIQRDAIVTRATRGGEKVGLEAENVTWGSQRRWADALATMELVPTTGLVEGLRLVKDAGEVARIAAAAAIADAALGEVLVLLGQGRTETEVALALDTAMRRLGSEDRAFETIVASGPNAAKPHARPTDRPIGVGDPVVIDFGATYDGYRSDMTRTFCVGGAPAPELARVFEVVTEAQAAGVAAVAPGVVTGDIDKVCRDRIGESGWADAFEHGTGHGVGLDIHEAPPVGQGSTAILTPGVVVTVEPGIYLAGLGGVRIEDTVVVTDQGCRPLTAFTKDIAA